MKVKAPNVLTAAGKGAAEVLLFVPLLGLLIESAFASRSYVWLCTLPVLYAAGSAADRLPPLRRFYVGLLWVIAAGGLHSYVFFGLSVDFIVSLPFGLLAAYRGLKLARTPWLAALPPSLFVLGLTSYFLVSLVISLQPPLRGYLAPLTACGLAALILTLLAWNLGTVKQETLPGSGDASLSAGVKWHNRLLIAGLFLLILLVALFRQLYDLLIALRDAVVFAVLQLIRWLLALLASEPVERQEPPPDGGMPALPPADEPAAWMVWLERALMAAVFLLLAAGAIVFLYWAGKRLVRLLARGYRWLRSIFELGERMGAAAGYEDDVESLVDWRELGRHTYRGWYDRLRRRFADDEKWEELEGPLERIRHLYRKSMSDARRSGYEWKPHLTPRESAAELIRRQPDKADVLEPLVDAYEEARYGGKTPEEPKVERLRNSVYDKA